jgi:gliding motility-associated-like protein
MQNKKNSLLKAILFFVLGLHSYSSIAQSGCENADLELGNFQNWSGETGIVSYPVPLPVSINTSNQSPATNGIIPGRHTIMTGNGTDPYSCGALPVVAPGGGTFSVRIGNDVSAGHTYPDAECERLRYVYSVTPQSSLIIYKYAVVLENPPHTEADQPRFEAKLLDQNGNIIPCTEYIVVASTGNPEFFECPSTGINYSPWKTVGVDVSGYVGQNVTLDFATADCAQGGHFGYAYVEAGCAPFSLDTRYCLNVSGLPSATIEAPSGFDNYLWTSNGQNLGNQSTITITNPAQGQVVTCQITSFNGCVANLQATLTPSDVDASFTSNDVCVGNLNSFVNTSTFVNSVQDSIHWTSSDGFTSTSPTFDHAFTNPGTYSVTMFIMTDAGCYDEVTQQVVVNPDPIIAFTSVPDPCVDSTSNLVINNGTTIASSEILNYHWVVNGVTSGTSANLDYYVPSDGNYTFTLTATSEFGCSEDSTFTIAMYHEPVADFTIVEQCFPNPVIFTSTSTVSDSTTYTWILNNTVVSNGDNYSANLPSSGSYLVSLVVSETHHEITCIDTLTETFIVHGIPDLGFSNTAQPCVGQPITSYNLSSVTPTENVSYMWSVDGVAWSTFYDFSYTFPASGVYSINLAATSDFGCVNDTTFTIEVYPIPQPPVLAATVPICPGDEITFTASAESNSTIEWSGPNNFNSQNFVVTMPFNMSDIGTYSAYITSQNGCISGPSTVLASILNIYSFEDFEFPNVITANGDGINDSLDINNYFKTCDEYTLYIFNRWGNLVFEQTKNSNQFVGDTENDKELVEGVYFYKMVINAIDGNQIKSGFIHIVKQ